MDAREAARRFQRYAKIFNAGAFATPTAAELSKAGWVDLGDDTIACVKVLSRPSVRRDWTGREYTIAGGQAVVTHLARPLDAPVPDLSGFDWVQTYIEDETLTKGLDAQGLEVYATQISAAGEIKAAWSHQGVHRENPVDQIALACLDIRFPPSLLDAARQEITKLTSWHDDFPLYSDGTWSALSLRGYRPDDPTWGVKPAEMPRKWHDAHPDASAYRCEWTTLAADCPALREIVSSVHWWRNLERVRLMRMAAKKGGGKLRRHTDITDRSAGTRDGQMSRFFLPLITHPSIQMHVWDTRGVKHSAHLAADKVWYASIRLPHAVTNPSAVDRVQLAVDVLMDDDARTALLDGAHL